MMRLRWPARAALLVLALTLAAGAVRFAGFGIAALHYPYDLDYGEGVVWQQMNQIMAGTGYAPLRLYPAIVFEYPPLFHVVTGGLVRAFGLDALFAGRLVALLCTLASAGLIGGMAAIAIGPQPGRKLAAGLAAALFLALPLTVNWAILMRIDMLALLLTLAGMIAAAQGATRTGWASVAGLLFAAALYAKQTALPAPAGAFVVLLLVRPRAAWTMAGSALVGGLATLAAVEWATGGGFLTHIVGYNINRVIWAQGWALAAALGANLAVLALAVCALPELRERLRGWRTRALAEPAVAMLAVVVATIVLKTAMLPAILKSGASDNYLIDWFAALLVPVALALRPVAAAALGTDDDYGVIRAIAMLIAGIALPLQLLPSSFGPNRAGLAADRAAGDRIAARIAASPRPVIGDQMVLILRGGQPVTWEPAILAELGAAGRYDERAFADMVRRGDFGFFVTRGDRGDVHFDQRYNPVVADAMDAAYPVRERIGELVVHLPRGGWPAVR